MKAIFLILFMMIALTSLFAENLTVRQFLVGHPKDWTQLGKDTFYSHLDLTTVREVAEAVAGGHQPWRMNPLDVILAATGIAASQNPNVSVILKKENVDFQTYEVRYVGQIFTIDLYRLEKVFFPISISFSENDRRIEKDKVAVKLTGIVSRLDFAGRPNYQSIRDGDEKETYWILTLDQPTTFEGNGQGEAQESGIQEVQLILDQKQYEKFRDMLGIRVVVTGIYFHGDTGHHRTKILVEVHNISKF